MLTGLVEIVLSDPLEQTEYLMLSKRGLDKEKSYKLLNYSITVEMLLI